MQEASKDLVPIESQKLMRETLDFCNSVELITIATSDEYEQACQLTQIVQKYTKKLESDKKKVAEPHKERIKNINGAFKEPMSALSNIKNRLRSAISEYKAQIERENAEKRRLAEDKAEKERERLRKEAEKTGYKELGVAAAAITTPAVPEEKAPEVSGTHFRKKWYAEVVDKKLFVEHCLTHGELFNLITVDQGRLNKFAAAVKHELRIPGIEIKYENIPIIRGA